MRARLVSALGIIVSLIAIFYLVQQFDLQQSQEILKEAQLNWLGLAAIAYLGLFPLRGLRWSWLLSDIRPVATRISTETFVVGAMANNIPCAAGRFSTGLRIEPTGQNSSYHDFL